MVRVDIEYLGELRCRCIHDPSSTPMETDAPVDIQGRGESFSPTDLVATALGSCVATTMAVVADRHGVNLTGMRVSVTKTMVTQPTRRIGKLDTVITIMNPVAPADRERLEHAARHCPVHASLAAEVEAPIAIHWDAAEGTGT